MEMQHTTCRAVRSCSELAKSSQWKRAKSYTGATPVLQLYDPNKKLLLQLMLIPIDYIWVRSSDATNKCTGLVTRSLRLQITNRQRTVICTTRKRCTFSDVSL
ncbi:hypothetical protein CHARACLAT_020822 [Characodon lateralis]|uniref:Uncharacterized protein n=1 Tax=Characodon lateralis TaxID=208331 RepID=A0ABU7DW07_9TELE|nr:hypothetical protein [Characodon lateralis]